MEIQEELVLKKVISQQRDKMGTINTAVVNMANVLNDE